MHRTFKPEEIIVTGWSSNRQASWSTNTPNGIKVVHLPTGIVVTCDTKRSQHRNRNLAFMELEEKLKGKRNE